jgi:type IV secretion system protein VirB5
LLQVLAVSVLVLAGGLAMAVWRLATRDEQVVTPYLVEVDRDGAVAGVEALTEPAEPTRPMVHHALRLFVLNARSVTSDRAAQRELILRAYAYASGRAVGLLNGYYRAHPPFARAARATVTPRITSFLKLSERDVYQVEWIEEVRNLQGALVDEEPWRAILTVSIEPPDSIGDALVNPLGIRVSDLDWTPLATDPSLNSSRSLP